MLLPYGKKDIHLIHISEVESGVGTYRCPYCDGLLLAKKGKQMAHHFAHVEQSCWSVSSYDFFGIKGKLPLNESLVTYTKRKQNALGHALKKLQQQQQRLSQQQSQIQTQIRKMVHSLQTLAQHSAAAQSALEDCKKYLHDEFEALPELHPIRHPSLFSYTDGKQKVNYQTALQLSHSHYYPSYYHYPLLSLKNYHRNRQQLQEVTDKIALYEQDLAYFRRFKLYFLKIELNQRSFCYKIGLSSRPLAMRIQEIQAALSKHFEAVVITVLYVLEEVAFLERFFKQKYHAHRYEIANFTEYFVFDAYLLEEIEAYFSVLAKD